MYEFIKYHIVNVSMIRM